MASMKNLQIISSLTVKVWIILTRDQELLPYVALEFLVISVRWEKLKKKKRHKSWNRKKMALFADNIIFYIENPKDSTKQLVEPIKTLTQDTGYKANIYKIYYILIY